MPQVSISTGAQLDYEESGSGTPIVMVHGFLGTPRTHLGSVIDWASANAHVYAPTLRGYGESSPKPRDFPADFYEQDARDVLAFMDACGIQKAHIWGYSDGGEVALMAAAMQPARFISAVTWGACGMVGEELRPIAESMYPASWVTAEDKALHHIEDADQFVLKWLDAFNHLLDAGGDVSIKYAAQITCPVLLMLGEQDELNPERYGQQLANRIPHGRLHMIANSGHTVHADQWEQFQQLVGSFLQRKD